MLKRAREWLGTVADVASLVALAAATFGAAILGAYFNIERAGQPWVTLAAIGLVLLMSSALRFGFNWLNTRFDPVGEESYLRGKRIRIVDLVPPGQTTVKGRVLEDCRLIGPAVIALDGVTLQDCTFEGDPDSAFIIVEQKTVLGPIAFQDCVLRRCQFQITGIIASAEKIADYKKGFSN